MSPEQVIGADEPTPTTTHHDLPLLSRVEAEGRGLATLTDLAIRYSRQVSVMRSWLGRPGAPAPVAKLDETRRGGKARLYEPAAIDHFLARADVDAVIGPRRHSRPPRLVGTRTSTAGRGYVWRDPRRPDLAA